MRSKKSPVQEEWDNLRQFEDVNNPSLWGRLKRLVNLLDPSNQGIHHRRRSNRRFQRHPRRKK